MVWALCAIIGLSFSAVQAEADGHEKFYTPAIVYDSDNVGEKGAVQLLWKRNPEFTKYEIEISNGKSVYREIVDRHTKHVMIYFDKDYKWRVRPIVENGKAKFGAWRSLKVVRKESEYEHRSISSIKKSSIDTYRSNVGVMEEITVDEGD